MAPALTKILKDGHGIHLSSPPSSVRVDSDGRAVHSAELEPHMRSTEDCDPQRMWLNVSLFPSLDSCLPASPLDVPAKPSLSPVLQASASQCEEVHLPNPASLLSLLSSAKGLNNSHQVVSVLPGVPDMFLGPVPEHNSQEACILHGHGAALECGPDGGDVHRSPFTLTSVSPSDTLGEIKSQGFTPFFAPSSALIQEKAAGVDCIFPTSTQPCGVRVNADQLASRTVLEEAVKEQISRQAGLQSRAWRLQKRLQALLGEHAVLYCTQQLEGLKKHYHLGDVSNNSQDSIHCGVLSSQASRKNNFSWPDLTTDSSSFREFCHFSKTVLRGLQDTLDSEATASSSSDEELEEEKSHSKFKTSPVSSSSSSSSNSSCERRWLEERAELGSRWSWLQLRLGELEGKIQQLVELHKHIRASKGGVVLAESQPLTDRQIQQTLLREMAGLSCTASDPDAEPCSPARLLHNIERQSAQLSQIVNSLMPPLSFSPLSKQAQTCQFKRTTSGQKGDDVFVPGGSKRRRIATRRLFKADVSCICARTRPLVTYQKPKLFSVNNYRSSSPQDSGKSTSTLSSFSCSCCSSCDPVVLCSDPDCSSSSGQSFRKQSSRPHPVLSLSFDTPQFHHFHRVTAKEEWSQRPLVINAQSPTPAHYNRRSSTPLHKSYKYKHHARHHKGRVMGLSPIRTAGSAQSQHRSATQRKRKRRHSHRMIEEEEDMQYQLCELGESSDEVLEESYTPVSRKQAPQGSIRKRQGESMYNINNIVIPMPLAKVEKLQYKDIITPRWGVVSIQSLTEEEDNTEGLVEDLSNETFAQRHMTLEQREKSRWSSWEWRKCCRRHTRSGSRLSSTGGGMCTSGEESSVEWSGAQLDTDEQPGSEEWLQPQTPWEPRVFPLDEDEEEALLCDRLDNIPSESGYISAAFKNSNSHLSPAQSCGATLPPGAQSSSVTLNSSGGSGASLSLVN